MKTWRSFLNKALLFALLASSISACNYSNVEVLGVESFGITNMDTKGADIDGKIKVTNPNNYKIKVTSSDAKIYLNDQYGGKSTLREPITIPANFTGSLDTKIRADFDQGSVSILPIIMSAAIRRSVQVDIKGSLKARSFIISKKIDFEVSENADFTQ